MYSHTYLKVANRSSMRGNVIYTCVVSQHSLGLWKMCHKQASNIASGRLVGFVAKKPPHPYPGCQRLFMHGFQSDAHETKLRPTKLLIGSEKNLWYPG